MRFFRRGNHGDGSAGDASQLQTDYPVCPEKVFHDMIGQEVRRTSRSGRPFLLVLLDLSVCASAEMTLKAASVLSCSTREIDAKGWYAQGATLGVLCTEFGSMSNVDAAGEAIAGRLSDLFEDKALRIVPFTMPAARAGREGLPPPWVHDRGRTQNAT